MNNKSDTNINMRAGRHNSYAMLLYFTLQYNTHES